MDNKLPANWLVVLGPEKCHGARAGVGKVHFHREARNAEQTRLKRKQTSREVKAEKPRCSRERNDLDC